MWSQIWEPQTTWSLKRAPLHFTNLLFISVKPSSHCKKQMCSYMIFGMAYVEYIMPAKSHQLRSVWNNNVDRLACKGVIMMLSTLWWIRKGKKQSCTSWWKVGPAAAGNVTMPKCQAKAGRPVLENPTSTHYFQFESSIREASTLGILLVSKYLLV